MTPAPLWLSRHRAGRKDTSFGKARHHAHDYQQTSPFHIFRGHVYVRNAGDREVGDVLMFRAPSITGVREDTSYTVLINSNSELSESRVLVKFDNYREDFTRNTSAIVVTDAIAAKLQSEFSEIRYFVNIKTEPGGGTTPVQVSRAIFNSTGPGLEIKLATVSKDGLPYANRTWVSG